MHLRVSEQDKVDLWAIAAKEDRDLSQVMRSLLKLGVIAYRATGNLTVVDVQATEEEPADEFGKEQRHLADAFMNFSRALDKFNSKVQNMFKQEETKQEKKERRTEWQQVPNR